MEGQTTSAALEKEAAEIREKIRHLRRRLDRIENIESGIDSAFWAVVERIIEERTIAFEALIYTMPPEKFGPMRDVVLGARSLADEVRAHVGKREEYLAEIDRLRSHLEKAQNAGRIRPVEVP